jgi:hypothetical protein
VLGFLICVVWKQGEDHLWSAGDEDFGDRRDGHRLTISKSSPSIPAKFSKYTRWKNRNRGQSRSVIVKQQLKERNFQNRGYFKEKSVFFQDFVAPVIIPEQVCQFSYSEHPSVAPIGFREPVYSPFGPENMARPWTGKRPYEPRKGIPHPEFDSFKLPPAAMTKARFVQPPGPFLEGAGPKLGRTREQILGEPLSRDEVRELVAEACSERRRLDLGTFLKPCHMPFHMLGFMFHQRDNALTCCGLCFIQRDSTLTCWGLCLASGR